MKATCLTIWVTVVLSATGPRAFAGECETLLTLKLPGTTPTLAHQVGAGAFTPEKPIPMVARQLEGLPAYAELPAFCRVALNIRPTRDSTIKVEVWMPLAGWNGRLVGSGNGAAAGFIRYPELGALLIQGYAVAGTDTGHEGAPTDWSFALGHPEKVNDFGYRAVHEMTVKAKAVIKAFYGQTPRRSYWNGCSTGGRQGLTEAQRYPLDFDGIVAGAPANYLTRLETQFLWVSHAVHQEKDSFLPESKMRVLHQAALRACDNNDGLPDGVIEDPSRCRFDPQIVECKGGDAPDCLTSSQVMAARAVYGPARNPRTHEPLYPGLAPGSEPGWGLAPVGQVLADPSPMTLGFFKYVAFGDPKWTDTNFDFDRDVAVADRRAGVLNAIDTNLSRFFARGGKLLQYHGWADGQLSPLNSIDYYERVTGSTHRNPRAGEAYRLFLVPGMDHCRGGEGTDRFDMLSALADWVERSQAPNRITASRIVDGRIQRTRPLCPYPQVATYKGSGDSNDAANFECRVLEGSTTAQSKNPANAATISRDGSDRQRR